MQLEAFGVLEEDHHDQQEQTEHDVLEGVGHTGGNQADEDDVEAELADKNTDSSYFVDFIGSPVAPLIFFLIFMIKQV